MVGEECQYICSNEGASGRQPMVDQEAAAPEPQDAHPGPSGQQLMATDDPVTAAEIELNSEETVDKAFEAYCAPVAGGVDAPGVA